MATKRTRLCMKRRDGEALWIGNSLVELRIIGNQVQVRVTADEDVPIVRAEIRSQHSKGDAS